MVFNSLFFVCTLLPFLGFFYLARRKHHTAARVAILLYSYFFYGMWNVWFLLLITASTAVDYTAALQMRRRPQYRKHFLWLSLVFNLGMLGFFKYSNFFIESFVELATFFGASLHMPTIEILLPVGISFYTFQTLSYTLDVYRGRIEPRTNLLDVAVYVAYFPQLVAGPILRAARFFPQIETPSRYRRNDFAEGIFLISLGLFVKTVIADNAATRVDMLFDTWEALSMSQTWTAAMLFGVQIHGDFSGYSMIAIGLARLMGYDIPRNFNAPYGALGLSDFWRRWHISLSQWLRDYLYISLGGNRGSERRTYFNLMATMLLGGLWHGASLRFVIWGGLHGAYLCAERILRQVLEPKDPEAVRQRSRVLEMAGILATFVLVSATWIPFRASTAEQTTGMLTRLIGIPTVYPRMWKYALFIGLMVASHIFWARRDLFDFMRRHAVARFALVMVLWLGVYYFTGKRSEFIYFQF